MTGKEYVESAVRTRAHSSGAAQRIEKMTGYRHDDILDLLHGVMGISTEAGEIMDNLKKCLFYGKPIDRVNLIEELGDLMWYIAIMCDSIDIELETVMNHNIAKLRKRYPEKFSEDKALNRDLGAERKILEV